MAHGSTVFADQLIKTAGAIQQSLPALLRGAEMTKIENQTLVKETLVLEELFFVNCVVRECSLFYSGGDFDWINTRFENCQLLFRDGAKRTMSLVQQFGMLKKEGEQATVGGTSSTRVQ
jgi:hypothetical protein